MAFIGDSLDVFACCKDERLNFAVRHQHHKSAGADFAVAIIIQIDSYWEVLLSNRAEKKSWELGQYDLSSWLHMKKCLPMKGGSPSMNLFDAIILPFRGYRCN